MEKITELLDNLDKLGELVPKLDTLLGWTRLLTSFAVRVGPFCILVLGLIYLLIPPKEANRKAGFRTYFGMGSVMAWRFTQFVSGILMTLAGAVLLLWASSVEKTFDSLDALAMSQAAIRCIKAQVICALVIWILMFLVTLVLFDRKGYPRFDIPFLQKFAEKPKKRPLAQLFQKLTAKKEPTKPLPQPEPALPEPEQPQDFEVQGQQVITADDIVIEGLE